MKAFLSLRVFVIAAALLCDERPAISASDAAQAVADDALPLEKIPERLKQIEADFAKQVDAFVAVVDAELAANRISDTIAQLLRKKAEARRSSFHESMQDMPKTNEAISSALTELDAAYTLIKFSTNTVVSSVSRGMRQRMKEAVLGKSTPEETAVLNKTLDRIQSVINDKKYRLDQLPFRLESFSHILDAIKLITEAESSRSATTILKALVALRKAPNFGSDLSFAKSEIDVRMAQLVQPVRKIADDKSIVIEGMIEARKPAQEIKAVIASYSEAIDLLDEAGANASGESVMFYQAKGKANVDLTRLYTYMASVLNHIDVFVNVDPTQKARHLKGAADDLKMAQALAGGDSSPDTHRRRNWQQILDRFQKELSDKTTGLRDQGIANLLASMAALKKPGEFNALWGELYKGPDEFRGLNVPLHLLQAFWEQREIGYADQFNDWLVMEERLEKEERRERSAAFRKGLIDLRNRILREVFVNTLKIPELTEAPYADKDPEVAVETFCDDLAQRSEWRRLLAILQLRASPALRKRDQKEDESIPSIRFFIAGNNFELAEQWMDAVLAYQSVLRNTSKRAPIKEAADSIKAIAKAHPETVNRENADTTTPAPKPATGPSATRPGTPEYP